MAKRVLTKEKIDRQVSGQSGITTQFMEVGDVHHPNRNTVSLNAQHLNREQLDNLTSMVYNMSIQKKETTSHLSPKYIRREREARTDKISETETEIEHPIGIE